MDVRITGLLLLALRFGCAITVSADFAPDGAIAAPWDVAPGRARVVDASGGALRALLRPSVSSPRRAPAVRRCCSACRLSSTRRAASRSGGDIPARPRRWRSGDGGGPCQQHDANVEERSSHRWESVVDRGADVYDGVVALTWWAVLDETWRHRHERFSG